MSGKTLIERTYDFMYEPKDKEFYIKNVKSFIKELRRHIEMQDMQIERLNRKNDKLERKYWEIKLKSGGINNGYTNRRLG